MCPFKGPVNDPRVTVDLAVARAAALGIHAEALSVKGTLDQRIIALTELSGRGAWGRLDITGDLNLQSMFPINFSNNNAGIEALGYDLGIQGEDLQPWQLRDLPLAWIGTWQGSAHLQGRGMPGAVTNQGQGKVDFSVSRIRLAPGGQPVDGAVSAEVRWDGTTVDVTQSKATIPDYSLDARGRIDLAKGQLQADGHLNSENMETLGKAIGIVLPRGFAEVKLKARGPLTRPRVTADMLAQEVRLAPYSFGRLLVSAELDSALNLTFSRLVLENQGSYIEGSAHMALADADPTVALTLDFDSLDPNDFLDFSGAKAFFNGHLEVSGSLHNPLGRLTLNQAQWPGGHTRHRFKVPPNGKRDA